MTSWSTLFRKLTEAKKTPGAYYDPVNGGIKTTHWFWGAAQKISSAKDKNQTPDSQDNTDAVKTTDAEQEVNEIILKNPRVGGPALINAMKARGLKVVKVSEAFKQFFKEKKHSAKWDRCVDKVASKGDVDSPEAVCTAQLGDDSYESYFHQAARAIAECQCEKKKEADSSSAFPQMLRKESAIKFFSTNLREAAVDDGIGPTRFKCILLQEGLGNLRDAYYYSKEALESAISVFTGSKIYADHPSAIEEESRPERSVRDVLGHFENIQVEEIDGRAALTGEVCILGDKPFEWARGLMRHAIEHAKKFPEKAFIGLSINAAGDADEVSIEDAIARAPESAKPKLIEAKETGVTSVRIVSNIKNAVSCDLVTEAGAGGAILNAVS